MKDETQRVDAENADEFFQLDAVDEDGLRLTEKEVGLTNQEIVELAYLWKETIGPAAEEGTNFSFSVTNCWRSSFKTIRTLLNKVDGEYLNEHSRLRDFFFNNELADHGDKLQLMSKNE